MHSVLRRITIFIIVYCSSCVSNSLWLVISFYEFLFLVYYYCVGHAYAVCILLLWCFIKIFHCLGGGIIIIIIYNPCLCLVVIISPSQLVDGFLAWWLLTESHDICIFNIGCANCIVLSNEKFSNDQRQTDASWLAETRTSLAWLTVTDVTGPRW